MLTHHQTQSVTMLQPILTVAPLPPPRETHFHSTQSASTVAVRTESHVSLCSSSSSLVSPPPPPTGTNSTNAVGGSGGLSQSQGGSQCLSAPQQRKGTFTDDLHKLVDNWARDAMNLSQVEARNSFSRGLTLRQSSRVQMFYILSFSSGEEERQTAAAGPGAGTQL